MKSETEGELHRAWKVGLCSLCTRCHRALRIGACHRAADFLSHHLFQVQMKDFRFSYKFKMACKEDVLKLCPNIKKKYVAFT